MDKHIEIRVNIAPLWAELVAEILLGRCGCSGVVIEEVKIKDDKVISADETVKAYLPVDCDFDELKEILKKEREKLIQADIKPEILGSWEVSTKEIPDDEWAHSWKKFWHPQKIGERTVIRPSWEEYSPKDDEIVIELDPGSAFGTGSHPTTRLCVQALERDEMLKQVQHDRITMADVGTGSGILAIAAVKLGVDSVVGVDNDTSVIHVAQENSKMNNVEDKCRFYAGSAADIEGKYDLVVANIITEVLVKIMPDLKKLMKENGTLILSGIISRKLPEIEASLQENSLTVKEILDEDDWVAVVAS